MTTPATNKKPKVSPSASITFDIMPLNVARYLATLLMGAAKFGMLGALPATNLAHVSWVIVLLPAMFLEVGVVSLLVIGGLIAVIALLLYVLWLSGAYVVSTVKYRRQPKHDPWTPVRPSREARERFSAKLKSDSGLAERMLGNIFKKTPKNE